MIREDFLVIVDSIFNVENGVVETLLSEELSEKIDTVLNDKDIGYSEKSFMLSSIIIQDNKINKMLSESNMNVRSDCFDKIFDLKVDDYLLYDYEKFHYNLRFIPHLMYDELSAKHPPIKIYRLEHNNNGIFSSSIKIHSKSIENFSPCDDLNISTLFPQKDNYIINIGNMTQPKYKRKWYFGLGDISDIDVWFDSNQDINNFMNKGVKIVEYFVPENFVIKGSNQVVFKLSESTRGNELSFEQYLNIKNKEKTKKVVNNKLKK